MTPEEFKALDSWNKVRHLSGMFVQDSSDMMNRLTIICLISRVELGDADADFLDKIIDKAFGE
jgi:hypothetical protein